MGKWCPHASLFLGNKDMFKNYKRFDFWHVQTADIGGTKPWNKKLLSYLKTIQIFNDFTCWLVWNEKMLSHWTQVSDRCPLGYLFKLQKPGCILNVELQIVGCTPNAELQKRGCILTVELQNLGSILNVILPREYPEF